MYTRSLIVGLFVLYSCNNGNTSLKEEKMDSAEVVSKFLELKSLDSIISGLRPIFYFDTNKNYITELKFDSLISTGEYEQIPNGIDLQLVHLTKDQIERNSRTPPIKANFLFPGSIFPSLSFTDFAGDTLIIDDFKGKIIVINFWFLACVPCRNEMKELNSLVDDYNSKNIVFLGITPDTRNAIKIATNLKFKYRIIPDAGNFISSFNLPSFPAHVVIDKYGKVVYSFAESGPRAIFWLRHTIDSCLIDPK